MSGPACPACGSQRTKRAFRAGAPGYLRCRECRTVFDPEPPGAERLRELYAGEEYFVKREGAAGDEFWGYPADYLADRPNIEAKFDRVLAQLERHVEPGRLLDVGCGPGFLLAAARARGWAPTGTDLNDWAVAYARDELGLDARAGELADGGFADAEFDAVTMMDLVEHVPDPEALIAEAARVVRPGGGLVLLTPDAGSPVSRLLGRRWPEVARVGEHTVLFSVVGLAALLERHGFTATGWHSIGKLTTLETLAADVSPVAPGLASRAGKWLSGRAAGARTLEFDPRTKYCLYARRRPAERPASAHRPPRIPRNPERLAAVDEAIVGELESLADARRFCDWMFDQFAAHVGGAVAEVGAGIGTFSERILEAGATSLLAVEPDDACADALERRFGADERVEVVRETLPDSPALAAAAGEVDLVVCQNVLEHIGDDVGAVAAIARSLRPGGRLALVVPAGASLFGALDEAYGHWRRYEPGELRAVVEAGGLEVESLRPINALGIAGWWTKNRRPGARIGSGSLRAYEAMVPAWRALEERLHPRHGLSLVCIARRA